MNKLLQKYQNFINKTNNPPSSTGSLIIGIYKTIADSVKSKRLQVSNFQKNIDESTNAQIIIIQVLFRIAQALTSPSMLFSLVCSLTLDVVSVLVAPLFVRRRTPLEEAALDTVIMLLLVKLFSVSKTVTEFVWMFLNIALFNIAIRVMKFIYYKVVDYVRKRKNRFDCIAVQ